MSEITEEQLAEVMVATGMARQDALVYINVKGGGTGDVELVAVSDAEEDSDVY